MQAKIFMLLVIVAGVVILVKMAVIHWFISSLVIGAAVLIFTGFRAELATGATIVSLIILFIASFFVDDPDKIREERHERQRIEQERQREEQERDNKRRKEEEKELERQRIERQRLEEQQRLEQERLEQQRLEEERRLKEERDRYYEMKNTYHKQFLNAKETLEEYYMALNIDRFKSAYNLLTPNAQKMYGTLEQFSAGRQNTISVSLIDCQEDYQYMETRTDESVAVNYKINATDKVENGTKSQVFEGTAILVKYNNSWKIDSLTSTLVESNVTE